MRIEPATRKCFTRGKDKYALAFPYRFADFLACLIAYGNAVIMRIDQFQKGFNMGKIAGIFVFEKHDNLLAGIECSYP